MAVDPIRVQTVFLGTVNLADSPARKAFLEQACGDDRELRDRVEALLRAHDSPDSLLDEPIVPPSKDSTKTHPSESRVDPDLSFLAPPQRAGSLGRIGHYEVLEVLGRGGFGIVFRAIDEVLQRVVAVKVLSPHVAATSPARKRFLREARAAAQIKHENVVQVHAVVEDPLPYLVMEFIPGETLQQRMDRTGPLNPSEVLTIGRQIAAGLAAAHEKGLVHRDIKPTNILVSESPQLRVTITDFGLARAADDASLTRSGIVAGTPMFMAPEQAKGETIDARADLFSLGSVLYQMCSGRPPFRASGTMAVLKRVCDEEPRPIRQIIPEVPEWLCRIIEKLHAKNPPARFQSAVEVVALFTDCEQQLATQSELRDFSRIPKSRDRTKSGAIAGWGDRSRATGRERRLWHFDVWAVFFVLVFLVIVVPAVLFGYVNLRASRMNAELQAARAAEAQAHYESTLYRSPANAKEGWTRIFNGKDFNGWTKRGDGSWSITDDGIAILAGDGAIFSPQSYDDFHLAAEVRVDGDVESALLFRCEPKRLNANLLDACSEAVIGAADPSPMRTGSLKEPLGRNHLGAEPNVQIGRWYTYEVIAVGEKVTLKVEGKTTLELDAATTLIPGPPKTLKTNRTDSRKRNGPIGLKFPGVGKSILFRNISIKSLKPTNVDSAVVAALQEKADAMQQMVARAQALHKAGQAPRSEVINAQLAADEAKLVIAEAQHNQKERIKLLEGLSSLVEEEKKLVDELVKAHVASASEANAMAAKVADMKARLAKARADAEGTPKP